MVIGGCQIKNVRRARENFPPNVLNFFRGQTSSVRPSVIDPLLFNVVLETAIRSSEVETGRTIFDKYSQIMAYADDVVIVGRLQSIKDVFILLLEQKIIIRRVWK
jgi:hypothetical protein